MVTKFLSVRKTGLVFKALSVLLVLAFVVASFPQPAKAACVKQYTVESGDTLSSIAYANNINYLDLASANNLTEPYTIFVGQTLCIPGTASSTTTSSSSSSSRSASVTIVGHRVVVDLSNYPGKKVYYVKVGEAGRNPVLYKLGTIRVSKAGSATRSYKLTKHLRDATVLTLCLKNAVSDAISCHNYIQ